MTNNLIARLAEICSQHEWKLVTAESCTGGLVAASITSLAGSSDWFERGYVTYSNQAKVEDIGVPEELILNHGAVSAEVARAMAEGAKKVTGAHIALAITGIAGPSGGSPEKPIGTVDFAWALPNDQIIVQRMQFSGDRAAIREQATAYSLEKLLSLLRH